MRLSYLCPFFCLTVAVWFTQACLWIYERARKTGLVLFEQQAREEDMEKEEEEEKGEDKKTEKEV